MIAEQPEIADYIGRALIDGRPVGEMIFDSLLNSGMAAGIGEVSAAKRAPTSI